MVLDTSGAYVLEVNTPRPLVEEELKLIKEIVNNNCTLFSFCYYLYFLFLILQRRKQYTCFLTNVCLINFLFYV